MFCSFAKCDDIHGPKIYCLIFFESLRLKTLLHVYMSKLPCVNKHDRQAEDFKFLAEKKVPLE